MIKQESFLKTNSIVAMDDIIDLIFEQLKDKASLKQDIFINTKQVFTDLKLFARQITDKLTARLTPLDKHVTVEFYDVSEFEFHVKFSSDLLVFLMNTNITTFSEEHPVMKTDYIKEDTSRAYFGSIMVYNFMSDTFKYSRMQDHGYLIARLLLNVEDHFYIEGVKPLNTLNPDIEKNIMNADLLKLFIKSCMLTSIENDLVGAVFNEIKTITLKQKLDNEISSRTEKIGFQISSNFANTRIIS